MLGSFFAYHMPAAGATTLLLVRRERQRRHLIRIVKHNNFFSIAYTCLSLVVDIFSPLVKHQRNNAALFVFNVVEINYTERRKEKPEEREMCAIHINKYVMEARNAA